MVANITQNLTPTPKQQIDYKKNTKQQRIKATNHESTSFKATKT